MISNLNKSRFVSVLLLFTTLFSMIALPARAYDDRLDLRKSFTAGFRLTIPLGATDRRADKVRYGLQLNMRGEVYGRDLDGAYSFMRGPRVHNARLVSLDFTEQGLKSLSLAGQPALNFRPDALEGNYDERQNLNTGLAIGIGVGLALAVIALAAVPEST